MNEIQATIHKIGTVTCALSGKEGEGLVVTFGEFKNAPLSWKSFRQLLGMRCPKTEAKPEPKPAIPNGPVAAPK
jgi:hypothetical protein